MPYIPLTEVESSNIQAIGYDRKTGTLRVAFHDQAGVPRVYDYPLVPEGEHKRLMESESKGRFFNSRIKPMFGFRSVRPEQLVAPPEEVPPAVPRTEDGEIDYTKIPVIDPEMLEGVSTDTVDVPSEAVPRTPEGEVDEEAIARGIKVAGETEDE